MNNLVESIQAITRADNVSSAKTEIIGAFARMGFDRICFSVNKRDHIELLETPDINNFGGDDQNEYNAAKLRECDAKAVEALLLKQPLRYDVDESSHIPEARRFFGFIASYGVKGGITVPLHSSRNLCSGLMLGTSRPLSTDPSMLFRATAVANVAMMKLELIDASERLPAEEAFELRALTAQQHDLLRWAAEGKSNTDIATITGLSRRGVDYHMGQIFKKLGVNSKAQAVALLGTSALTRRKVE